MYYTRPQNTCKHRARDLYCMPWQIQVKTHCRTPSNATDSVTGQWTDRSVVSLETVRAKPRFDVPIAAPKVSKSLRTAFACRYGDKLFLVSAATGLSYCTQILARLLPGSQCEGSGQLYEAKVVCLALDAEVAVLEIVRPVVDNDDPSHPESNLLTSNVPDEEGSHEHGTRAVDCDSVKDVISASGCNWQGGRPSHSSDTLSSKLAESANSEFWKLVEPLTLAPPPAVAEPVQVLGAVSPPGSNSLAADVCLASVACISAASYRPEYPMLPVILLASKLFKKEALGGPVLDAAAQCVGLVFRSSRGGGSAGKGRRLRRRLHVVPALVIAHVLSDLMIHGRHMGFPSLGITATTTVAPALRQYLGIDDSNTGMRVSSLTPGSPSQGILRPGDVLMQLAGMTIAADGTAPINMDPNTHLTHMNLMTASQPALTSTHTPHINKDPNTHHTMMDPVTSSQPDPTDDDTGEGRLSSLPARKQRVASAVAPTSLLSSSRQSTPSQGTNSLSGSSYSVSIDDSEVNDSNGDVITSNGDVITSDADVITSGGDVSASNADVITSNGDITTSYADVAACNGDVTTSNADDATSNGEATTSPGLQDPRLHASPQSLPPTALSSAPSSVVVAGSASTSGSPPPALQAAESCSQERAVRLSQPGVEVAGTGSNWCHDRYHQLPGAGMGSYHDRYQQLPVACTAAGLHAGQEVEVEGVRGDGSGRVRARVRLSAPLPLVPPHLSGCRPSWMILGGLLLTPCSVPFMMHKTSLAPPLQLVLRMHDTATPGVESQLVVVGLFRDCASLVGHRRELLEGRRLVAVGGCKVVDLQHAAQLVFNCKEPLIRLEFDEGYMVVLDRVAAMRYDTREMMEEFGQRWPVSADLRDLLGDNVASFMSSLGPKARPMIMRTNLN